MYSETIEQFAKQAEQKIQSLAAAPGAHFVRSMLAGMYVGASVVLVFVIGATLPPSIQKLVMGVCFGGALTRVLVAGSELVTGLNLVLTLGVLRGKTRFGALLVNWIITWLGNLAGAALLAWMVVQSGILDAESLSAFILSAVDKKMNMAAEPLFVRAVLANWLVCLAVWMSARTENDAARILLIWWCMFTFIACGYEHSVANMCTLTLGMLLPHGASIGVNGYAYNLGIVTAGNVIGGGGFVGVMVWAGHVRAKDRPAKTAPDAANPVAALVTVAAADAALAGASVDPAAQ